MHRYASAVFMRSLHHGVLAWRGGGGGEGGTVVERMLCMHSAWAEVTAQQLPATTDTLNIHACSCSPETHTQPRVNPELYLLQAVNTQCSVHAHVCGMGGCTLRVDMGVFPSPTGKSLLGSTRVSTLRKKLGGNNKYINNT